MVVWLVKFEEPLPIDLSPRLYRMGTLAEYLVRAGHSVVWWTSTFDHSNGRLRFLKDTVKDVSPHLQLRLLHTTVGYARSVSGGRAFNNIRQARRFWLTANGGPNPDLIFCAMPTPELAWVSSRLGRRYKVPLLIDARDMWPDVFNDLLSPVMRIGASPYLGVMRAMLRSAVRSAYGCTAITEPFLDWILTYADRPRGAGDTVFPLGYSEPAFSPREREDGEVRLRAKLGRSAPAHAFKIVFLGRLNRTVLDVFDAVVTAARQLRAERRPFRFYFAGTGDCVESMRRKAAGMDEIIFPGQLGAPEVAALRARAHVALLPIARRRDYQISLSNKVFEYLAAGLPIVSHLTGLVGDMINRERCGVIYDDAEQLARHLKRLADNEDERIAMGEASRRHFLANYETLAVYSRVVRHMETCVSAKANGPGGALI
jgi:glycosyltransferase involved in cell wall biosynthesis